MDAKSKLLLFFAINFIGLGLLLIIQSSANLGKLRFIACDVGQGDGMLIITPSGKQIVVDGGPGNRIVDCLSQKIPFWDRKIEMILLTHPQKDHIEGLVDVLKKYEVGVIASSGVKQDSETFKAWEDAVSAEKSKVHTAKAGDRLILDSVQARLPATEAAGSVGQGRTLMQILWPTRQMLDVWKTSPPSDLNDSSIVLRLEFGSFCAYLTGDIPKETLQNLIDKNCQILKVSHHGSKTGTNEEILEKVGPEVAVVQVGKNSYGHPHKDVLDLLRAKEVKTLRNDIKGLIEIDFDGKKLTINN